MRRVTAGHGKVTSDCDSQTEPAHHRRQRKRLPVHVVEQENGSSLFVGFKGPVEKTKRQMTLLKVGPLKESLFCKPTNDKWHYRNLVNSLKRNASFSMLGITHYTTICIYVHA